MPAAFFQNWRRRTWRLLTCRSCERRLNAFPQSGNKDHVALTMERASFAAALRRAMNARVSSKGNARTRMS